MTRSNQRQETGMPKSLADTKVIIRAGVAYFALVFGVGFLLGCVRVPFLVPWLGERSAELIEMPFMFVAVIVAARFVCRRFDLSQKISIRLPVGLFALGLLLAAEVTLAILMQDQSLREYIASRDPISGPVYLLMLGLFGLMPTILAARKSI
jgi:hypothetical protein